MVFVIVIKYVNNTTNIYSRYLGVVITIYILLRQTTIAKIKTLV